jgi:hypothetical protein
MWALASLPLAWRIKSLLTACPPDVAQLTGDNAGPGGEDEQAGPRFDVSFVVGGGIGMRFALD